jgi:hypothetical protein
MNAKGQAAMEYMTTYGWAMLIVGIALVVLWQMGIFEFQSRINPSYTGFSILIPREWAMDWGPGNCVLSAVLANEAGEELKELVFTGGGSCAPNTTVEAGDLVVCSKTVSSCARRGDSYDEDVVVTYKRSYDNQSFQTAGTLWGNIE